MEARYQATASPWLLHQSYLNDTIRSQSHRAWDQLMWVNTWFLEVASCFWMKLIAKRVLHQLPTTPCGCCDHPLFGCKMPTYLQILCIYSLNSSKTWDSVRQTSLQIKVLSFVKGVPFSVCISWFPSVCKRIHCPLCKLLATTEACY